MALQSIRGTDVLNYSNLGKSIVRFRKANTSLMLEQIEAGFMDGGCLAFATSLKSLISTITPDVHTKIVSVGMSTADHAVLEIIHPKFGLIYIDGDGVATKDELCNKMIKIEGLRSADVFEFNYDQDEVLTYEEIGLPAQLFNKLSSSEVAFEIMNTFRTPSIEQIVSASPEGVSLEDAVLKVNQMIGFKSTQTFH